MPSLATALNEGLPEPARRKLRRLLGHAGKAVDRYAPDFPALKCEAQALHRELSSLPESATDRRKEIPRPRSRMPTHAQKARAPSPPDSLVPKPFSDVLKAHRGAIGLPTGRPSERIRVSGGSNCHRDHGKARPRASGAKASIAIRRLRGFQAACAH